MEITVFRCGVVNVAVLLPIVSAILFVCSIDMAVGDTFHSFLAIFNQHFCRQVH